MKLRTIRSEPEFQLSLTEREATILCALFGCVEWSGSSAGLLAGQIYETLNEALPDRTESFVDFFDIEDGEIRCP